MTIALAACGCGLSLEPHVTMAFALAFGFWLLTDAKNDNAANLLCGQVVAAFWTLLVSLN